MTAKEAAEILEGELKSLSSARGSDYSGVLALKHAISVLQELPDEQAVRQNIRQQMVSTVAESLNKVISGINSTEICNQIVSDNLRNWCERTQCKLRIAMNYLPYQGKALSSAQPEPCEDVVSRQRLLSDLKELTAAWGKYPVMEEQIKGVEAAIGYVETIPSAQPEIIYCKDCKWKNRHNCTRAVEVPIDDDKYCAWAERRTG